MPLMGTFDILDISYFDSVDLLCYIYTIFNCPPPVKEGGTLKTGCVCLSVHLSELLKEALSWNV